MSRVPPRAVRRAIIDPLWIPVAAAIAVVLLAVAVLAGICGLFTRRRRLLRITALALVYVYLDVALVLGALTLLVRLRGEHRDPELWRARHAALLGRALSRLTSAAERLVGFRVELVGRPVELAADRPVIVLARHAGPGDSFSLVRLLVSEYHRTPRVVLKSVLQWDPGLDVVLTRLRCYFLPSASGAGEDRAAAVAGLAGDLDPADALLLFPEGGNWTPRRHRRAILRLRRRGRHAEASQAQARTHVLPPRPGGSVAALQARPDADVLVVAHAGLDTLVNPGQVWNALPLDRRPMRVRVWRHAAVTVPRSEPEIHTWLDCQWEAIDQWIDTERRHD